jgi:septal ring factor EnvC (AmiA/AmiB activator)
MLSKDLMIQQDKEEKELMTLQGKVEKLQKSLEEKEVEVIFLKEKVAKVEKENEEAIKVHDADMTKMKEQNKSISELRTSIEATRESITNKDRENQRILETLELLIAPLPLLLGATTL